jgi:hypothetical protein
MQGDPMAIDYPDPSGTFLSNRELRNGRNGICLMWYIHG